MLRIVGAACIMITCTATGIVLCQRMTDRVKYLEKLLAMLDFFSAQISYARMPMGEIIASLAALEQFRAVTFLKECGLLLDLRTPFPQAWQKAVPGDRKKLAQEDYDRLLALGESLGTTDAQDQDKTIQMYARLFAQSHEKARAECASHAKMYTTLGVLVGLGAMILLI